ncbi:DNA helicase/exodeoxyribonuclease V beta subunit [Luteibacter rhizovicinus]|uniref:RecBCD enzyme subunit RecB n=1 Tax=Luteibacter rhizovicinus TaxID=242606 RepID=A0A4R3YR55_9GAMM|nr:exodeoxyribonuclease V subunit beta [Luteibacter rhizovicinus]TCV94901.1 DNA helicase/exodeoxyribonuclease V beta subunit [Luteibacter rhizovicinus]
MSAMEILRPLELPLAGVRLIEASAGTGKTWTIAALYVRAVLGHGLREPLLPPRILVVTFTEAATQELRERIRARLVHAARAFRGRAKPDEFLVDLMAAYPSEQHAGCARQLELAAQWMDEAAIFTIHGWSQRMLTQHAFGSGHPFAQTLEPEDGELLAECVRDYWRQTFYPLADAEVEAVLSEWSSPDALLRSLRPLLSRGEATLLVNGEPLPAADDLQALFADRARWRQEDEARASDARASWLADAARIEALLTEAVRNKTLHNGWYKPDRVAAELVAMRHWAATGDMAGVDPARFSVSRLAKATGKKAVRPEHPVFAALEHWAEGRAARPEIRHAVLADALDRVRERFEAQKRRRAQMGFDDLLLRLDRALAGPAGPELAGTIREQYLLALIDEFQDTDPLQYRIFRAIYMHESTGAGTALLLIGDPKQAIYAFRGADIHTYLGARDEAMSPRYGLDTNHRSTHAMVAAVNAVFAHGERHATGAFHFDDRGLPFASVQAKGRDERFVVHGTEQKALTLWLLDDEAPVGVRDYRAQMAEACASEIVRLLTAADEGQGGFVDASGVLTPLLPRDIAVLVRSHVEAAEIRSALSARRVRSVFLSDRDSVLDSQEARDVLFWLRACAEPASDRHMRAALATRTLALGLGELARLNADERHWERRGREFLELRDTWQQRGVLAMLHRLLHIFDLPSRLLASDGGERALTNLLHLAELLQQAASTLDGELALIRYLGEALSDARAATGDETIVRLESDADLVKVVTVHKSKGLEYPLVFLPFVCAFGRSSGGGYRYHDAEAGTRIELLGASASDAGDGVAHAKEAAERAALQEDLRLLYVALTRARHACWLGIAPVCAQRANKPQLHKSAFGHLLTGGAEIDNGQIAGLLTALASGEPSIAVTYMPAPDDRAFSPRTALPVPGPARVSTLPPPPRWWIASYSALRHGDEPVADYPAPDTPEEDIVAEYVSELVEPARESQGIHAFPRGAEPGTFLHDLLEWIAEEGFAHVAADPAGLRDAVARRCERRVWTAFIEPLYEWLFALLTTPLALPDGGAVTLASLDDPMRYRAELEFWFEARDVDTRELDAIVVRHTLDAARRPPLDADRLNGMLKGFIDLIVEHDGRYYVVDYKSNWLGADEHAYTPAAMRASILESRYELQYAIYLLALHRQLRARLGDSYDYDRHVGGAVYLYLRGIDGSGMGVHTERPPRAMVEALDALFAGSGV